MNSNDASRQGPVVLRTARVDDAGILHAAVLRMAEDLGQRLRVTSTADDFVRMGLGSGAGFDALIAEIDAAFAGMCIFFPSYSTWIGAPGVYVQDIYIEPAFRGKGVGERLLARVAAMSGDRGGAYMRLSVDAANVGAQAFYGRMGLDWSSEERIFIVRRDGFRALAARDGTTG